MRETDIPVFFRAAAEQGTPRLAHARPDIRKCASRCRACGCLRHARDGDVSFEGAVVVPDAFSGSSPSLISSFFRLFTPAGLWKTVWF